MDLILNLEAYLNKDFVNSLLEALDKERTNSLILNTKKMSKETFKSLFPLIIEHPFLENVFYYDKNIYEFGKSYLLITGCYYIIDASSLLVSKYLNIDEGDLVLDMCAAPGGKSISLLLSNQDKDFNIISNDLSHSRALELSKNIERIGTDKVIVTNNDFSKVKNLYKSSFDKIILDAPCSGSAMFRKNELAKIDWSIEKVLRLQNIQINLLKDAIYMLKDGGEIIYSTCSFSFEENEAVILNILNEFPNVKAIYIEDKKEYYKTKELKEAIHLFPNLYKGEGQFICLLKKDGIKNNIKPKKENIKNKKLLTSFNLSFPYEINIKDTIYFNNFPLPLDKLNLIRPGLEIGTIIKNNFTPSFHLAHFLDNKNSIVLNDEQLKKYLHGEQLETSLNIKNGYYIVSYNNINLGFIKNVNGKLKNYYPKGLRQ